MGERAVVNGVELYWAVAGESGPPLVLVHGSWGDHHGWDRVVPLLARSFRVLTYDRRGHSRSGRPAGQGNVHEDVADLAALMAHVGLRQAHILGNSFGAVIVLHLAVARPELFRSLLAHEPPLLGLLDRPPANAASSPTRERIAAVLALLNAGQMEAGAQLFMETVAFGPGAWAQFPPELRETFVRNAPTFLDEEGDPDSRTIDAGALEPFARHPGRDQRAVLPADRRRARAGATGGRAANPARCRARPARDPSRAVRGDDRVVPAAGGGMAGS